MRCMFLMFCVLEWHLWHTLAWHPHPDPRQENLGDCHSTARHHPESHHIQVNPYYLYEPTSPIPKELWWCVRMSIGSPIRLVASQPASHHWHSIWTALLCLCACVETFHIIAGGSHSSCLLLWHRWTPPLLYSLTKAKASKHTKKPSMQHKSTNHTYSSTLYPCHSCGPFTELCLGFFQKEHSEDEMVCRYQMQW